MSDDDYVPQYSKKELYHMQYRDSMMKFLHSSVNRLSNMDSEDKKRRTHQSKRDLFMNKYGRKYVTNYGGCKRVAPEYYQLKKAIHDKYPY